MDIESPQLGAQPGAQLGVTVFYDGGCPVCSREISQYRRAVGAERLAFIDAANCPPEALAGGLTREAALARLHVRLADGSMVSGVAAFAALWRQLPRLAWAGRIAGSPVVLPFLALGYQVFLQGTASLAPLTERQQHDRSDDAPAERTRLAQERCSGPGPVRLPSGRCADQPRE